MAGIVTGDAEGRQNMVSEQQAQRVLGFGDAAVEGLVAGIAGGVAMAALVLVIEWAAGTGPLTTLGYFDASATADSGTAAAAVRGLVTHLAVSGVYGVVFGMIVALVKRGRRARPGGAWLIPAGALYGLIVLAVAEWVILPRTTSVLGELPLWVLTAAHLVYGVVLAEGMGRSDER